jgi:hypothetical protein
VTVRLEADEQLTEAVRSVSSVTSAGWVLGREVVIGPLIDGVIVGEKQLGTLVQRTAINAARFVTSILNQAGATASDAPWPLQAYSNRRAVIRRIAEDHAERKREKFYSTLIFR